MNLGLFGGTFDPVHRGHLRMARAAATALRLERIYFTPARLPWHKDTLTASYADRYAMLALALRGQAHWLPLDIPPTEPLRPTYSVEDVAWLQKRHPRARIFFIIGADAFAAIQSWHRYQHLLELCDFILLARAGYGWPQMQAALPTALIQQVRGDTLRLVGGRSVTWLPRFRSPLSSTSVRQALLHPSLEHPAPLPSAVRAYAARAGLYTPTR